MPGIGQQVNGAYLGVKIGPISFQPAEFGKIAIVIFLAAYLRDTRQVLVQGSRRFLGVTIPPLKHFGPLLVVWGAAMLMLVFIRDLGSSLMYFGALPGADLRGHEPAHVRGRRACSCSSVGAWFFATTVGHVQDRIDIWLDPFAAPIETEGYQIANGLFAHGRRRAVRARAWARRCCNLPERRAADPGAADRHDLRRHRQRPRARRRVRADRSSTC